MGLAFAAVINSLVNDLIMPVIAMIIGKPDFSNLTFTINDAVFRYGSFITHVIQFVAIAAAVFLFIVRPVNMLLARFRSPAEEGMPDEERRHQELLAALRENRASA
jgi:large conductance mechanosensitive channel